MYSKLITILKISSGLLLKLFTLIIPKRSNVWIFGAGKGQLYNENSKYLFEYINNHRPDIKAVWITQNKDLVTVIKKKGFEVYYNYSFKGLFSVLISTCYFFSTVRSDVEFFFPLGKKKVINLFHGMPIKKIIYDYDGGDLKKTFLISKLYNLFVAGFMWEKVHYHIATSSFFTPFLLTAYNTRKENILISGLPRNDLFYMDVNYELQKRYPQMINKYVISYLPTHRKFGKGKSSPIPFLNSPEIQEYFEDNNILFVYKAHYNESTNDNDNLPDSIIDLSKDSLDTQLLLSQSDLLISDYSSCIIDFIIQDKPFVGYFYDDYQNEDTSLYFNIENQRYCPGPVTFNEKELFESIKNLFQGSGIYASERSRSISLYHQYRDGKSAERIVNQLLS